MLEQDPVRARLCSDERLLANMDQQLASLIQRQDADKLSLSNLQKRVSAADTDIAELAALRGSLQSSITRRRATLTPRSLPEFPLEILGMIFKLATDAHALTWSTSLVPLVTPDRSLQPFKCAAVCRRWYSAALATPSLWTYLGIPSCWDDQKASRWHSRIKALLHRSRACSLHIEVVLPGRGCDREYSLILADLLLNCSRWRHISLSGLSFDDEYLGALRLLHRPTPQLEAVIFSFGNPGDYEPDIPAVPPVYLPYAPKLRTVHLENVPITLARRNGTNLLPASSLAFFEDPYDLQKVRDTISSFAALSTLSLYWEEVDAGPGTGSPILLPDLVSLVVSRHPDAPLASRPSSFATILDNIETPKLRELDILPDILPLAENLTRRTAHTLESLRLTMGDPPDARMVPALASLTELRTLSFQSCLLDDADFFDALCAVPGGVWPMLQHLVLAETEELDQDAFVRFIQMRYPLDGAGSAHCALLDVDLSKDELLCSVAAGEIGHILETEKQRRLAAKRG